MGITVGMPILKLDLQNHYGKADKHSGNAKAILDEMLADDNNHRQCSDPDYNKELTANNKYYLFDDGKVYDLGRAVVHANNVYEEWTVQAESHKVVDKNGKQKKLRVDAGIGFAGIVKPLGDKMRELSTEDQIRFCEDSIMCLRDIFNKRKLTLDYAVIHLDEGVPHVHYCGHDNDYKLGKKLGLPLYKALNDTEYPVLMRKRGWDVDALKGYDLEAIKDMTKEEKKEFNKEYRKKRKEHGLSSGEYKAKQEAEKKKLQEEQKRLEEENNRMKVENEKLSSLQQENMELQSKNSDLKSENNELIEQIANNYRKVQNSTNLSEDDILRLAEKIIKDRKQKQAERVEQAKQIIQDEGIQATPGRSHEKRGGKISPQSDNSL